MATWFDLTAQDVEDVAALKIPSAGDLFYGPSAPGNYSASCSDEAVAVSAGRKTVAAISRSSTRRILPVAVVG